MWGLRVQAGSLLPLSSRMRAVRAFTSLCLPQCPHLSSWSHDDARFLGAFGASGAPRAFAGSESGSCTERRLLLSFL